MIFELMGAPHIILRIYNKGLPIRLPLHYIVYSIGVYFIYFKNYVGSAYVRALNDKIKKSKMSK